MQSFLLKRKEMGNCFLFRRKRILFLELLQRGSVQKFLGVCMILFADQLLKLLLIVFLVAVAEPFALVFPQCIDEAIPEGIHDGVLAVLV